MKKYNFTCPNRRFSQKCSKCDVKGLLYYSSENKEEIVKCETDNLVTCNSSGIETLPKEITRQSITKEREVRASKDFKNNVLPSLPKTDRDFHLKNSKN